MILRSLAIRRCQGHKAFNYRSLKTKVAIHEGAYVRIGAKQPWISSIGLEVHAQLLTKTKLFSRAVNAYGASVNSQVSLFDASTPGTLPVINKKAVELALKAALALNCRVNAVSTFDRKHYFYADLPAGYQITQQRRPIASQGHLDFIVLKSGTVPETYTSRANIIQLQIEQDSGKSLHDEERDLTLVDLNRCGSALIEIVFGPDLFHGEDAASLIKELILILQRLEVCSGQMETGAMRVDANISVRPFGSDELGTRTEVKNINSVRGLVNAIEAEVDRQIEVLENGGVVINETRTYDGNLKRSVPMRDKEVKQDYRFMPEPNLPPLRLSLESKERDPNKLCVKLYRDTLPELPAETRQKLMDSCQLPVDIASRLTNEPDLLELFFDAILYETKSALALAKLILNEVPYISGKHFMTTKKCLNPEFLATANNMKLNNEITHNLAMKALESSLHEKFDSFQELLDSKGWLNVFRNEVSIGQVIENVIEANPKTAQKFSKNGKSRLLAELTKLVLDQNDIFDAALVKTMLEKRLRPTAN